MRPLEAVGRFATFIIIYESISWVLHDDLLHSLPEGLVAGIVVTAYMWWKERPKPGGEPLG